MIKVVYFDEGSATDYLTVKNGGSLVFESQHKKTSSHSESGHAGLRIKSLFNYLFVKGDAESNIDIDLSNVGEKLINTTISNTILSDFLDLVDKNKHEIIKLTEYRAYTMENSIAYFQTITPFLRMAEGKISIDEEFKFKIDSMHDTLKESKGYYELLGVNKSNKESNIILRFNNNAFKNNYSISDLEKMDFIYYGVKVGSMKEELLDFNKLFDTKEKTKILTSIEDIKLREDSGEELDVYDIILAGVN